MSLVNLTPHPIHILDNENNVIQTLPPSGFVFRLQFDDVQQDPVQGIPVAKRSLVGYDGSFDWVTPDVSGVIVSAQTVEFMKNTVEGDIHVYTVGAVVRDDAGAPLGVKNLVLN
jgi:hypothetical protein